MATESNPENVDPDQALRAILWAIEMQDRNQLIDAIENLAGYLPLANSRLPSRDVLHANARIILK